VIRLAGNGTPKRTSVYRVMSQIALSEPVHGSGQGLTNGKRRDCINGNAGERANPSSILARLSRFSRESKRETRISRTSRKSRRILFQLSRGNIRDADRAKVIPRDRKKRIRNKTENCTIGDNRDGEFRFRQERKSRFLPSAKSMNRDEGPSRVALRIALKLAVVVGVIGVSRAITVT